MQRDDEILSHLSVAQDPAWTEIPTPSFQQHADSTENSLLTTSLRTEGGVRAMRTYLRRSSSPDGSPSQGRLDSAAAVVVEVCTVFSLGNAVNGIKDTCHGAMISLMLDEGTGQLAAEVFGRYNIMTAGLDVRYKRRLETPCVVLCRAWVADGSGRGGSADAAGAATAGAATARREDGASEEQNARQRKRRVQVEGRLEDREGRVFATGKAIFARIETKL